MDLERAIMDNFDKAFRQIEETLTKLTLETTSGGSVTQSEKLSVTNPNVTGSSQETPGHLNQDHKAINGSVKVKEEDDNKTSPTVAKLLEQYRAGKDAKIEAMQLEIRKKKEALSGPNMFDRSKVPRAIRKQIKSLPICSRRDEIIKMVRDNQMVIIIGETGSGKSTQIPQYLAEAGFTAEGKIGITQPRRVAAKSLADRVAKECGVDIGTLVGYAVRFDKSLSDETVVKYMTDGLLVKECTIEPNLDSYSVIIIDEAHACLLKRAASRRPDLKILVSSATLEIVKFSECFYNAPVFSVSGKAYKVQILYEPIRYYVQGVVDTVFKIHKSHATGDILVFLTGQEVIDEAWTKLEMSSSSKYNIPPTEFLILPCYGALPFEEQQKIFEKTPKGCRKVVLTTNIAETSITIDGIVHVIDSGFFKQSEYNSRSGIHSLVTQRVAKQQAIQRAGRAGRTCPGKCYRLYSESQFKELNDAGIPEIKRCNLESVVLDLIAMGIRNPVTFDFMDPPNSETILEALEHLKELQALDHHLQLTPLGRKMSKFPLDPPLARVVMESVKLSCSEDILKIVSIFSTQYSRLFFRPKNKRAQVDASMREFHHSDGDHLMYLKIYDLWEASGYCKIWCDSYFFQHRVLCEAAEIREQLSKIWQSQSSYNAAILSQYIHDELFILRDCSLFPNDPPRKFIMYHEITKTFKANLRVVIEIDPQWVVEYAPQYAMKIIMGKA